MPERAPIPQEKAPVKLLAEINRLEQLRNVCFSLLESIGKLDEAGTVNLEKLKMQLNQIKGASCSRQADEDLPELPEEPFPSAIEESDMVGPSLPTTLESEIHQEPQNPVLVIEKEAQIVSLPSLSAKRTSSKFIPPALLRKKANKSLDLEFQRFQQEINE